MSARRWWLALAAIPAFLLVGAVAFTWFVAAQVGWDEFGNAPLMSHGGWGVLGGAAVCGVFASYPLVSAWILARAVPGRRPRLLPGLCALSGTVLAVALAWAVEVQRVKLLRDASIYAILASFWLGLPVFLAGLICWHHARVPERAWFFRPCARVAFAVALFSGTLQMFIPLDMSFFQWKVSRAKAYVEDVAREVERSSVRGRPPEDIAGILARHEDPSALAAGDNLKYERGEDSFKLEFFCGHDWIKGHYWTYRSPPGTWKKRVY